MYEDKRDKGISINGSLVNPELKGLEIIQDSSMPRKYTVNYKGKNYLDNQPIKGSMGDKGSYIAKLIGVQDFRDKIFIKVLKTEGVYDGKPRLPLAVGLQILPHKET